MWQHFLKCFPHGNLRDEVDDGVVLGAAAVVQVLQPFGVLSHRKSKTAPAPFTCTLQGVLVIGQIRP